MPRVGSATAKEKIDKEVQASQQPSSGQTRQAVVEVLAEAGESVTITAIERAVGSRLPSSTRDIVEVAVDGLVQDGLISRAASDSRWLQLTERGVKLASGLRALAAG